MAKAFTLHGGVTYAIHIIRYVVLRRGGPHHKGFAVHGKGRVSTLRSRYDVLSRCGSHNKGFVVLGQRGCLTLYGCLTVGRSCVEVGYVTNGLQYGGKGIA